MPSAATRRPMPLAASRSNTRRGIGCGGRPPHGACAGAPARHLAAAGASSRSECARARLVAREVACLLASPPSPACESRSIGVQLSRAAGCASTRSAVGWERGCAAAAYTRYAERVDAAAPPRA
eukprot:scaffold198760_cov28-Tisochrysis_lutea.AAC.7